MLMGSCLPVKALLLQEVEDFFALKFGVKVTHDVKKFVGFEFKWIGSRLILHQESMIKRLIQEYRISKTYETPIIQNLKWDSKSSPLKNIRPVQKIIGELSYVANMARPELSYAVNRTARS